MCWFSPSMWLVVLQYVLPRVLLNRVDTVI